MDNQETITKLSEALNTLIAAYEDLQLENMSLKSDIDQLNEEKSELENNITSLSDTKSSLEDNIDNLNDNNKKQNTNINSMLGKIQNLLSDDSDLNKTEIKTEENIVEENIENTEEDEITKNIFDAVDTVEEKKNENNNYSNKNNSYSNNQNKDEEGKLDLNRMASLLNGFK